MTTEKIATAADMIRPRLTLSIEDYERLSVLASAARQAMPILADELAEEVSRAHVLAKGERAHNTVRMNSDIEFRDDTTGTIRKVTLVYPEEADIALGKISVMTPVGTALIGLPTGRSITWETPSGDTRQLTVLAVHENQPT